MTEHATAKMPLARGTSLALAARQFCLALLASLLHLFHAKLMASTHRDPEEDVADTNSKVYQNADAHLIDENMTRSDEEDAPLLPQPDGPHSSANNPSSPSLLLLMGPAILSGFVLPPAFSTQYF
jgi:hypothetical protein